ncbi:hypothetical protein EHO61_06315 [Leptospira fluminis]|uniref:Uncharacterized protein n=1 Tax=Leptospira fluminis TaxID=2484979 RepID=A0A4R9GSQ6_9LEPT|nr:hypothetical protein [Leptospira fluminis]TGK20113.1 hypothetical protein EHO61_06315 [Leptospira fluminis]
MSEILTVTNSFDYYLSSDNDNAERWIGADAISSLFSKSLSKTEQTQITTSAIGNIFLYLKKLAAPIGYPEISDSVKDNSIRIINKIKEDFHIIPLRVAPSIEGGIAIVYKKIRKKLFSNKEIEVFIEVYNHGNIVIALIKNSNLIELDELDLDNDSSYSTYFKNLQFDKVT